MTSAYAKNAIVLGLLSAVGPFAILATTPAPGHVNPMLGIARILLAEGHEVVAFTGRAFKDRIEGIGAEFRPIAASSDQDLVDPFSKYPELKTLPPRLELLRVVIERLFIDTISAHHEGLQQVLRQVQPDIENKADVNARVAWSGVGIDLKTNTPTPRDAVRRVLDTQSYRARASLMAQEFARIDTRAEILRIVAQSSHNAVDGSCADMRMPRLNASE
jgi:UDP:flavonoid glycosyltransferase YjiC (YdhE family)